jgi:hypothetical protein
MDDKTLQKWGKYPRTQPTDKTEGAVKEKAVTDYKLGLVRPSSLTIDEETGKATIGFKKMDVNPLKIRFDLGDVFMPEKGALVKRKPRNPLYGILTHQRRLTLYPKLIDEYVVALDEEEELAEIPKARKEGERKSKIILDPNVTDDTIHRYEGVLPTIEEVPYPPDSYEGDVEFGSYVTFSAKKQFRGYLSDMTPDSFRLIDPVSCKKSPPMAYPEKFVFIKSKGKEHCDHVDTGSDKRSWADISEKKEAPGRLVRFSGVDPSLKREGTVLAFSEKAFWVSSPDSDELIPVGYDNPTVKVEERKKAEKAITKLSATLFSTILDLPVTEEIRRLAVDVLYNRFSEIVPDVESAVPGSMKDKLNDGDLALLQLGVMLWKAGEATIKWRSTPDDKAYSGMWVVTWKLPGGDKFKRYSKKNRESKFNRFFWVPRSVDRASVKEMAQEFTKRGYYDDELTKWYRSTIGPQIEANMPVQEIRSRAEELIKQKTSPVDIIREIKTRYGDDAFHIDAEELYLRLRDGQGSDDLDHELLGAIEMIPPEDRWYTEGPEFAKILVAPIARYVRRHNTEYAVSSLEQSLRVKWMGDEFELQTPSKKDIKLFDKQHKDQLEDLYLDWVSKYLDVVDKQESIKEAFRLSTTEPITEKGQKIKDQTIEFETRVFESHGFKTSKYLKHVLMPLIFLEGDLGRRAKFFRAKLEAGVFEIQALATANLAHYLPELMMNFKRLGPRLSTALGAITTLNYSRVLNFVSMYSHYLNYRTYMPLPPLDPINWDNYLVSVLEECKSTGAMKGGLVARDEEGRIIYSSTTVEGHEVVSPKEDLADLTICYDAPTETFSCHDTASILHDIKYRKSINPITKKPYQEKLVERLLRERRDLYEKLTEKAFDPILVTPTMVDPEIAALFVEEPDIVEQIEEEIEREPVTGLFKKMKPRGSFPNLHSMTVGQLRHFIKRKAPTVDIPRRMGDNDKVYKNRLIELILSDADLLTGYSTLPPLEEMKPAVIKKWMRLEGIDMPKGTGKLRGKGGVGERKREVTKEDIINAIITTKYEGTVKPIPELEYEETDVMGRDADLGIIWGDEPEFEEEEEKIVETGHVEQIVLKTGETVDIKSFNNPIDELLASMKKDMSGR